MVQGEGAEKVHCAQCVLRGKTTWQVPKAQLLIYSSQELWISQLCKIISETEKNVGSGMAEMVKTFATKSDRLSNLQDS